MGHVQQVKNPQEAEKLVQDCVKTLGDHSINPGDRAKYANECNRIMKDRDNKAMFTPDDYRAVQAAEKALKPEVDAERKADRIDHMLERSFARRGSQSVTEADLVDGKNVEVGVGFSGPLAKKLKDQMVKHDIIPKDWMSHGAKNQDTIDVGTAEKLKAWQTANGLPATGAVNPATYEKLMH